MISIITVLPLVTLYLLIAHVTISDAFSNHIPLRQQQQQQQQQQQHPIQSIFKQPYQSRSSTSKQWESYRTTSLSEISRNPTTRTGISTTSTQLYSTSLVTTSFVTSITSLRTILHNDPMYVLMSIILISTAGIQLERTTKFGKALSAPLATMAVALAFANVGNIIPFTSPIYNMINTYLVPLAVPMLLFDSDLNRVLRDTGSLLIAFGVGAVATVVGTIVIFPFIPMVSLAGGSGWKVACALAARHIGGAINFVAVAETLAIPGTVVSAAIAADNVVVAIYFAILFALAKEQPIDDDDTETSSTITTVDTELDDYTLVPIENKESKESTKEAANDDITLTSLALSISVASVLVTVGKLLTRILLPSGTSSLPLTSILTVIAATIYSKFFTSIRKSGTAVGIIFIQMFFAASGAAGSIGLVLQQAPSLFAFSIGQIAIHFVFLMTVGRYIFKLPDRELYLASNANVGGPTTAAAMAQAKNWKLLILPALLIGILGYATATAIALALGPILLRLPLFR